MEALDVDELLAQLLVTEGFSDITELAYVDEKEISSIAGFDEDTAQEIQARASDFINKENEELEQKCKELGIKDDLLEIEELSLKIQEKIPGFECIFVPDHRQEYANSWPDETDGTLSEQDWGFKLEYDLDLMCTKMIESLSK